MSALAGTLISLAVDVGTPFVRQILSDKFGPENARLTERVVGAIAERTGVLPDDLEQHARDYPDEVRASIEEVERMVPELVQLQMAETHAREAILLAETKKGGWRDAWRPAAMYMLGFLWLWNAIVLHVLNAAFKIALPPMDAFVLLQVTGIYMGLYMGGHTVKEAVKSWKGKA